MVLVKLNKKSQSIAQPDNLKINLKPHQLAMLYKCLTIEKTAIVDKFPFGVMADKAGAGKTAVIISLILADKLINGKTQNLIVVPQHIHSQWVTEIKKFTGDFLSVLSITRYSDISELFYNHSILVENDIIITTSLYYELILSTVQQNNYKIKRIVLDELDSMNNIFTSILEKEQLKTYAIQNTVSKTNENNTTITLNTNNNKIIWFVSASIDNAISESGLKFQDKTITLDKIAEVTCQCEESFIDSSNSLEIPVLKQEILDDLSDDYFNFLSVEQLDSLNSLSYNNIRYSNKVATNSLEALCLICDDYLEKITQLEHTLSLKKQVKVKPEEFLKDILQNERDLVFNTKLLESFYKGKNTENYKDMYEQVTSNFEEIYNKYTNTKKNKLNEIFDKCLKSDKFLIFSDFTDSFRTVSALLDQKKIKYGELNSGNIKGIDEVINNYKNGDTSVLLIDSSQEGCGINLENTTCIIFLHKTSEILYNQIVGRAQRPGRTCVLNIITLLHKNEIV